ncbi:hypothetical protein DUI87_00215 [Hirundo rustica rustica]|uniref:Receptor for retinol uptake STRA6 n=1 Tax=Hirundo rustica rustica TaxID=333673 RepID=A0A3M0LAZ7_HIRRU|nr:hypothetical protein DUI87_00215 [Hirundo rustica rustica]
MGRIREDFGRTPHLEDGMGQIPGGFWEDFLTWKMGLGGFQGDFSPTCGALYQGAVLDVFSKAHILRPSREAVVCWIGFSGFQAAFACLQVIFFLGFVAFTFLVVIPLQDGTGSPLFGIIRNMWRALHVVAFLLFPINVLVGLVAGLWRVVISGLHNAVHLCRLDISLLHRRLETLDPGYHTYCQYLRVEVSQCHPLLRAFCILLIQPGRTQPPAPPRDTHLEEGGTIPGAQGEGTLW